MKEIPKLAVLIDPNEVYPPSDKKSLEYLQFISNKMKINLDFVTQQNLNLLNDYSSLFIRTLTDVNNYTYQWAILGEFLNLKMIDSSKGIALGSDKHLQFELCKARKIKMPKTQIIYSFEDIDQFEKKLILKFPFVLKIPNGAFSNGVFKIHDFTELKNKAGALFASKKFYSLLLQEYIYTDYDWRIGILNHKPLFVCKYYMAPNHWQIIKYENETIVDEGGFETIAINKTPDIVLACAQTACELLDDGLYGVDIKLHNKQTYLIEINDNPNVCFGIEDLVDTDRVYTQILASLI